MTLIEANVLQILHDIVNRLPVPDETIIANLHAEVDEIIEVVEEAASDVQSAASDVASVVTTVAPVVDSLPVVAPDAPLPTVDTSTVPTPEEVAASVVDPTNAEYQAGYAAALAAHNPTLAISPPNASAGAPVGVPTDTTS